MPRAFELIRDAAVPVRGSLERRRRSLGRAFHGARRQSLALVTPWPPEQSGPADYSRLLVTELAALVDVQIVVSGALEDYEQPLEQGVSLVSAREPRTAAWLRRRQNVLYCMGNSGFHRHVYDLLRVRPGAVLLHDVQLTGFFGAYAGSQRPEDPNGWLLEQVERRYGAAIPGGELSRAMLSWEERDALGIQMTAEVLRHAEQAFVHSGFAREVAERESASLERRVRVTVMPFGMPAPDEAGLRGRAAKPPLVVHMGALSETKDVGILIDAFAAFARKHPAARLVLGGPDGEGGRAHWQGLARERAPGTDVEVTGHLDAERYGELLRRADLAVQLRRISNGEASLAVCDCLAAGIPTIVTDLGWMGELPRSAVAHLPRGVPAEQLAARMDDLTTNAAERAALSGGALACAGENSFRRVAGKWVEALALV
jgi:glycosyltransferase involved in cell wall biosynthesis